MPVRIMLIAEVDAQDLNDAILADSTLDQDNPNADAFARPVFEVNGPTITGRIAGWELNGGDFGKINGIAQSGGMDLRHYDTQDYPQNVLDDGFRFEENIP